MSFNHASAQEKQLPDNKLTSEEKMRILHSTLELNEQLSLKFGEDYSLDNQQVLDQIKANIIDPRLTMESRKTSLFIFYGDNYKNHLHLIEK